MTLSGLGAEAGPNFNNRIDGTWGEFVLPAGHVSYIMTNARLGRTGTDWERRLTSKLRPVREVLDVRQMNLDQLLQRDLDDHRVATELIPYLIRPQRGPVFLPPILAVLLPFEPNGEPSSFDPLDVHDQELEDDTGLRFRATTSGHSFKEMRLLTASGQLAPVKHGRLYWNDEHARIVVLDGQHRAMALLAIDRTLRNTWDDDGKGARYRHFYEDYVLEELGRAGSTDIDMVHAPVTVCWFPDLADGTDAPHRAARKLFVDVNRNARPPSEDRVILLSDDDLLNILTRSVLNDLRVEDTDPPLFAVEYDNPTPKGGYPGRWSTMTSLQAIKGMVDRAVFGPDQVVNKVHRAVSRGRPNEHERNIRMRKQLRVRDILPAELRDGAATMRREELAQQQFTHEALPVLRDSFQTSWGSAITAMLGNVAPYRAHIEALRALKDSWPTLDPGTASALAHEAIFEGVGMYWTLRNSVRSLAAPSGSAPSDVSAAWLLLEEKHDEFRALRARELLGPDGSVENAETVMAVYRTMACQIGLSLMTATLCYEVGAVGPRVAEFSIDLVQVLNQSLLSTATASGHPRLLAMSPSMTPAVNRIIRMNVPRAAEFRYLWLEILAANVDGLVELRERIGLEPSRVMDYRDTARQRYVAYLTDEGTNERWRLNRQRDKSLLRTEVAVTVHQELREALAAWFEYPASAYDEWRRALIDDPSVADEPVDEEDEEDTEDEEDADHTIDSEETENS